MSVHFPVNLTECPPPWTGAHDSLIDDPEMDDPRRSGRAYDSADPRQSVSGDTDSQMDMDADDS